MFLTLHYSRSSICFLTPGPLTEAAAEVLKGVSAGMNLMVSPLKHSSHQLPLLLKTSGDFMSATRVFHLKCMPVLHLAQRELNCSYHPLLSKMNPLLSVVILLTIASWDTCLCSYYFRRQNCPSPLLSIRILAFNIRLKLTSSRPFLSSIL